jgi:hypothetical protein
MKKNLALIYFVAALFSITACKKTYDTYTGPSVVEVNPIVKTLAVGTVAAPGSDDVKLQLVGPQRSTTTELTYTIDASSTAVAGTHYNIPNSGKVTFPANSSFAYIHINLVGGSIAAATTKKLVIVLTGGADLPASANYKTYTLTLTP